MSATSATGNHVGIPKTSVLRAEKIYIRPATRELRALLKSDGSASLVASANRQTHRRYFCPPENAAPIRKHLEQMGVEGKAVSQKSGFRTHPVGANERQSDRNNVAIASSMSSRLPLELIELVLHNVDDRRTLGRCGLVCKTWLTLTRPALFSSILLRMGNAHGLAKLLRKPKANKFGPSVRKIILGNDYYGPIIRHPWMQGTLPRLIEHFTGLTTLRLSDAESPSHLLPAFRRIARLELMLSGINPCFTSIVSIICSLPLLQEFSLETVSVTNTQGFRPLRDKLEPLEHLHTMRLDYPPLTASMIEYIMSAMPPPPVSSLYLVLRGDWTSVMESVRAAGPALRSLFLSFPDPQGVLPRCYSDGASLPPITTLRIRAPQDRLFPLTTRLISDGHLFTESLEELVLEANEAHESVVRVELDNGDSAETPPPMPTEYMVRFDAAASALHSLSVLRVYVPARWEWDARAALPLMDESSMLETQRAGDGSPTKASQWVSLALHHMYGWWHQVNSIENVRSCTTHLMTWTGSASQSSPTWLLKTATIKPNGSGFAQWVWIFNFSLSFLALSPRSFLRQLDILGYGKMKVLRMSRRAIKFCDVEKGIGLLASQLTSDLRKILRDTL
ncbi:hypothetical protein FB451DRAFT_1449034 [Mycena latifolia]|nr:hypothetical protein FB451DRAFT_1449034 [Mycena latifolia]